MLRSRTAPQIPLILWVLMLILVWPILCSAVCPYVLFISAHLHIYTLLFMEVLPHSPEEGEILEGDRDCLFLTQSNAIQLFDIPETQIINSTVFNQWGKLYCITVLCGLLTSLLWTSRFKSSLPLFSYFFFFKFSFFVAVKQFHLEMWKLHRL